MSSNPEGAAVYLLTQCQTENAALKQQRDELVEMLNRVSDTLHPCGLRDDAHKLLAKIEREK